MNCFGVNAITGKERTQGILHRPKLMADDGNVPDHGGTDTLRIHAELTGETRSRPFFGVGLFLLRVRNTKVYGML